MARHAPFLGLHFFVACVALGCSESFPLYGKFDFSWMLLKRREALGEDAYHYCWLQTQASFCISFPFLSQKVTVCYSTRCFSTTAMNHVTRANKPKFPILLATIWRILCRHWLHWRVAMSPCCHGGAMFFGIFWGPKSTFGSDPQGSTPAQLGAKRYFHPYGFGP